MSLLKNNDDKRGDFTTTVNATNARKNIYQLISDVNVNSNPVTIIGKNGNNAVLISEADWKSIQEMIYINSVPELVKTIIAGHDEPAGL